MRKEEKTEDRRQMTVAPGIAAQGLFARLGGVAPWRRICSGEKIASGFGFRFIFFVELFDASPYFSVANGGYIVT